MTSYNLNMCNISGFRGFEMGDPPLLAPNSLLTPKFKEKVDIVISTNIDLKPRALEAYNYYLQEEFFFDRFYE